MAIRSRFRPGRIPFRVVWGMLLCALCGGGCDSTNTSPGSLGDVTGVVALDGKPLAGANVQFAPLNTRMSSGLTNSQGRYQLWFKKDVNGAAIGSHEVRISFRDPRSTVHDPPPESLPPRYNELTILSAVVKAGKNEFDFHLESFDDGADGPNLASVAGVVTFNGKPLANARLLFLPGDARLSTALTNRAGRYELLYEHELNDLKGAAVGRHEVRIRLETDSSYNLLPERYDSGGALKAEVKEGENEINFDLMTGE